MAETIRVGVEARDRATSVFRRIGQSLTRDLVQPVERADQAFRDFTGTSSVSSRRISSNFNGISRSALSVASAFGAIVTAAAGFGAIGASIVSFDRELANIATLGITAGNGLEEIRDQLLQLPPELGNTTEAANTMFQVIAAGTAESARFDVLTESLRLARVGLSDTSVSVQALTTVIAAYGAENISAAQASDIFAAAARQGRTDITLLAKEIGPAVTAGAALGISFDEIAASAATLATAFPSTAEAATALEGVFQTFISDADRFRAVGIDVSTAFSGPGGLINVLEQLREVTGGNIEQLAKLFTEETALLGVTAALGKQFDNLRVAADATANAQGTVAQAFIERNNSISASFSTVLNAFDRLAASFQSQTNSEIVPALQSISRTLTENRDQILDFGNQVFGVLTDAAGAGGELIRVFRRIGGIVTGGGDIDAGLQSIRDTIRTIREAIGFVEVGFLVLARTSSEVQSSISGFFAGIVENVALVIATIDELVQAVPGISSVFGSVSTAAVDSINQIGQELRDEQTQFIDVAATLDQEIAGTFDNIQRRAQEAALGGRNLQKALEETGRTGSAALNEVGQSLAGVRTAANETAETTTKAGEAAKEAAEVTGGAFRDVKVDVEEVAMLAERLGVDSSAAIKGLGDDFRIVDGVITNVVRTTETAEDAILRLTSEGLSAAEAQQQLAGDARIAAQVIARLGNGGEVSMQTLDAVTRRVSDGMIRLGDDGTITLTNVANGSRTAAEGISSLEAANKRVEATAFEVENAFEQAFGQTRENAQLTQEQLARRFQLIRDAGGTTAQQNLDAFLKSAGGIIDAHRGVPPALRPIFDQLARDAGRASSQSVLAFERFGIQTRSQLRETADQAVRDFNTIRKSGEATPQQIEDIWVNQVVPAIKAAYGELPASLDAVNRQIVGDAQAAANDVQNAFRGFSRDFGSTEEELLDQIADFQRRLSNLNRPSPGISGQIIAAQRRELNEGLQIAVSRLQELRSQNADTEESVTSLTDATGTLGAVGSDAFTRIAGSARGAAQSIRFSQEAIDAAIERFEQVRRGELFRFGTAGFRTSISVAAPQLQTSLEQSTGNLESTGQTFESSVQNFGNAVESFSQVQQLVPGDPSGQMIDLFSATQRANTLAALANTQNTSLTVGGNQGAVFPFQNGGLVTETGPIQAERGELVFSKMLADQLRASLQTDGASASLTFGGRGTTSVSTGDPGARNGAAGEVDALRRLAALGRTEQVLGATGQAMMSKAIIPVVRRGLNERNLTSEISNATALTRRGQATVK